MLERAAVVGGLAASFDVAGVRVDHGSHRLHPSTDPFVLDELRALLGADLQLRERNGRLRLGGRWVRFPPDARELVRRLPRALAARLALDIVTAPVRRGPRADTFAEVVRARLGPTLAHDFYFPYVEKIWALPPHELSGELARRRVGARSGGALVKRALGREPQRSVFYAPRRGYGQIVEALAAAASAAGAVIRTEADVIGIEAHPDRAVVALAGGERLDAGLVLSTIPLPVLARIGGAPDAVRTAAARLTSRALVLVYLALRVPQWTPYDAHYFPGLDVPMSRVSEPKNYRDNPEDPRDVTVLCAEVPCSVGDDTWTASDDTLGRVVGDALVRSGLPRVTPFHVETRRVPNAYPVYRVGYERDFAAVDDWAGTLPNVVTFGRHGLFAHDNTHHALSMAWGVADAFGADGRIDATRWSAARSRFRDHVVED